PLALDMATSTAAALAQGCAEVQPLWAQLRTPDRARYLRRAAQAVIDELDELVPLFAQAHDRTPGEVAALELLPAIDGLSWLADAGARALRDRRLAVPRSSHPVTRARLAWEPLGVVGLLGAADAVFAQPLWPAAGGPAGRPSERGWPGPSTTSGSPRWPRPRATAPPSAAATRRPSSSPMRSAPGRGCAAAGRRGAAPSRPRSSRASRRTC